MESPCSRCTGPGSFVASHLGIKQATEWLRQLSRSRVGSFRFYASRGSLGCGQVKKWTTHGVKLIKVSRIVSSIDESFIIPVQEVLSCLSLILGRIMAEISYNLIGTNSFYTSLSPFDLCCWTSMAREKLGSKVTKTPIFPLWCSHFPPAQRCLG